MFRIFFLNARRRFRRSALHSLVNVFSVGYLTLKAASSHPVHCLRDE